MVEPNLGIHMSCRRCGNGFWCEDGIPECLTCQRLEDDEVDLTVGDAARDLLWDAIHELDRGLRQGRIEEPLWSEVKDRLLSAIEMLEE